MFLPRDIPDARNVVWARALQKGANDIGGGRHGNADHLDDNEHGELGYHSVLALHTFSGLNFFTWATPFRKTTAARRNNKSRIKSRRRYAPSSSLGTSKKTITSAVWIVT